MIMGNTLLDQLKKTGLIDEKKAQKAQQEKHRKTKQQKGKRPKQQSKNQLLAKQAQAEKVARDRKLNEQRKQAAEKKAIAAQIKQIVTKNRVEVGAGTIVFNFIDENQVHRLNVTEKQQDQLATGQLAIIKLKKSYEIVPAEAAEKVILRDPACVVVFNITASAENDQDDPYADYKVPDDLIW